MHGSVHTSEEFPPASSGRGQRVPVLFWLTVACVIGIASAIGLSLWVPRLQQQRALKEIERLDGKVVALSSDETWSSRAISAVTGRPAQDVIAIDLSGADLSNSQLRVLTSFPYLKQLSIAGPQLTDDGLRRLRELTRLEHLILVNCPQVSPAAEQQLQREIPGLEISRRGPALLGVSGDKGRGGFLVHGIRPGTAADAAGLVIGDTITAIDGHPIRDMESLARRISHYRPGQRVTVTVRRDGQMLSLPAELGSWKRR